LETNKQEEETSPNKTLKKSENLTANSDTISIYAVTWNLHGKSARTEEVAQLIPKDKFHHIYVIGTEECMRSILTSLLFSDKSAWENMIQEYLGNDYVRLRNETLSAIHLIAFAHKSILNHITNIKGSYIKNGFYGTLGNKGSVAVSFDLCGRSVLLLNSHLAAGQAHAKKRNDDFQRINSLLKIEGGKKTENTVTVSDRFDICLWLGDFNYRIDLKLAQAKEYLKADVQNHIPFLLQHDQMKLEIDKGNLPLNNFTEAEISFRPTYKLIPGTHDYVLEEGGDRIPGWTDRILYKSKYNYLRIKEYNSIQEMIFSDHKPVFAIFELSLSELKNSKISDHVTHSSI